MPLVLQNSPEFAQFSLSCHKYNGKQRALPLCKAANLTQLFVDMRILPLNDCCLVFCFLVHLLSSHVTFDFIQQTQSFIMKEITEKLTAFTTCKRITSKLSYLERTKLCCKHHIWRRKNNKHTPKSSGNKNLVAIIVYTITYHRQQKEAFKVLHSLFFFLFLYHRYRHKGQIKAQKVKLQKVTITRTLSPSTLNPCLGRVFGASFLGCC